MYVHVHVDALCTYMLYMMVTVTIVVLIAEVLCRAFTKYGEIKNCHLVRDIGELVMYCSLIVPIL